MSVDSAPEALEDPTMIILCVSAAVSLLIGVVKGWPNPMSECYEGLAIVMAVTPEPRLKHPVLPTL